MTIQEQADAILAGETRCTTCGTDCQDAPCLDGNPDSHTPLIVYPDDLLLRLAQDRDALLKACKEVVGMYSEDEQAEFPRGSINWMALQAIKQAERPR